MMVKYNLSRFFLLVSSLFLLMANMSIHADDYPIKRLTVGTTMTINSINIDDYYYGISIARKGWFKKNDVLNSYSTEEIRKYFQNK